MAFVDSRVDLGLQIFSPSPRKYTSTGPASNFFDPATGQFTFSIGDGSQSIESENDVFLLPHFAWNNVLSPSTTLGIAIYGNGGMNTEYKGGFASVNDALTGGTGAGSTQLPGTYGAGTAGVNLEQLFFNLNGSYKLNPKHALGASIIVVGQRFRAQGLEFFSAFSLDPTRLSGNRTSTKFGLGGKLGYQGEVAQGLRVGISYQSKIYMDTHDEYAGLFAEGGEFDIPSTFTLGASFDVGKTGVIVADYQRIMYSDVKAISNPISKFQSPGCLPASPTAPASGAGCLGGSDGAGFGWEDIGVFKVGYQWTAANFDWRVGYSYSDQPIPESEVLFNILAPAVNQQHLAFGLSRAVGQNQELNFSLVHALDNDVTGPNAFDPAQTIKLEMSQWDLQFGWAWIF
jgi:long-chain fatty acid transport protein